MSFYFLCIYYTIFFLKNKVKNDKPFQLVSIIEGQGTVEGKEVKKGDHFVVCSDQKEVDFDGTMTVMICTL